MTKRRVLFDNLNKKLLMTIVIVLIIAGISFATMQQDNAKKVSKKTDKKTVKKTTVKKKPKITMTGKPSCRSCCKRAYKWYTRTWQNYCPNCKRTNVLRKNPKGVPEKELTCSRCDCDYCVVCGHDKSGGRRHYTNILHG